MDVDMVKVKICGVTTVEDALMAANAGADMLGLNFYKKSPRYLTLEAAREMAEALRSTLGAACPLLVGVFVNELVSTVSVTMEKVGLNFAQLSGDESGELLRELHGIAFKAIRPRSEAEAIDDTGYFMPYLNKHDARIPTLLIDAYQAGAYGGTGEQANYAVASAVKAQVPRLMLAGGLNPDNVAEAVRVVQPWGVDVASGVEIDGQAGRKDETKVQAFISAAKSALA